MAEAERIDRARRHVDAPPEAVFAAWTDPGVLVEWLPPEGATMTAEAFEPEPGGEMRLLLEFARTSEAQGKTSAKSDRVLLRFLGLDPPRHRAIAVDFDCDDLQFAGMKRMDWTFAADSAGTEVESVASNVPPGIVPDAHRQGLDSSHANLARNFERT